MKSSNIVIKEAESPDELEAVYKFRYLIYVKEMNRVQHYANHEKEIIVDPLDDGKCHDLVAYDSQQNMIGIVRVNFSRESDLGFYEDFYQMQCVGDEHPNHTAIITRLMIHPAWRKTTDLAVQLNVACFELGLKHEIKFAFMDCNDHLVKFFTGFGWREYIGKVEHSEYGLVTPMRLDLLDFDYLKNIHSPFLAVFPDSN